MNKIALSFLIIVGNLAFTQKSAKTFRKKTPSSKNITRPKLEKIKEHIPLLIPYKNEGKFGFITQNSDVYIQPEYDNAGFFAEDCNLLHSPNESVRKFGSSDYASVSKGEIDYRIDINGKKVYQYSPTDLAPCPSEYKKQKYNAFVQNGFYGIIDQNIYNANVQNFTIYPQYQYLHILEGDDVEKPMIIASLNNYFGIIDINGKIIIPFEYSDIKRNFSWKLAHLFEVTKDGKNYYYIDIDNKSY